MIGEVGQVAQDPHFCYLPELGYKLEHISNGGGDWWKCGASKNGFKYKESGQK